MFSQTHLLTNYWLTNGEFSYLISRTEKPVAHPLGLMLLQINASFVPLQSQTVLIWCTLCQLIQTIYGCRKPQPLSRRIVTGWSFRPFSCSSCCCFFSVSTAPNLFFVAKGHVKTTQIHLSSHVHISFFIFTAHSIHTVTPLPVL